MKSEMFRFIGYTRKEKDTDCVDGIKQQIVIRHDELFNENIQSGPPKGPDFTFL